MGEAQAVVGPENALRTGRLAVNNGEGGEFGNGPWNRGRSITNFSKEQTGTRVVRVLSSNQASGEGKGELAKQGTGVEQRRGSCGEVKLGTWWRR